MNNMETFWSTSHAAGAQSSYLESLYESYLDNPSSIPDDWKIYFDSLPSIAGTQEEVSHKEIIEKSLIDFNKKNIDNFISSNFYNFKNTISYFDKNLTKICTNL